MNGYCGREFHPDENDVGFLGVIIENLVMTWGVEDFDPKMNVPPGTEFVSTTLEHILGGEVYHDIMYTVMAPDGRKLELMEHEIEVIGSVVTS